MATLGPVAETIFALPQLDGATSPLFEDWSAMVRSDHSRDVRAVLRLVQRCRPEQDLLWMLGATPTGPSVGRLSQTGLRTDEIADLIDRFASRYVLPYWTEILSALKEERRSLVSVAGDLRGRQGGLPARCARWTGTHLAVPGPDRDVHLGRHGLLFVPSFFLTEPAVLLREVTGTGGQPVLVYQASSDRIGAERLWRAGGPRDSVIVEALLGRTRARLLQLTATGGGTTSELAEQIGASAASVSQHTGVLRKAGLIESNRERNTVIHRITRLGRALLAGALETARDTTPQHPQVVA